jgi:hypothetical protein
VLGLDGLKSNNFHASRTFRARDFAASQRGIALPIDS